MIPLKYIAETLKFLLILNTYFPQILKVAFWSRMVITLGSWTVTSNFGKTEAEKILKYF